MVTRDDKPRTSNDGRWSDKKHRDDTPSFIRNVQARAELLNPNRSSDSIPVLAMPKSVRIWRRVRWPLFIAAILAVLAVIGFFTQGRLVDRSVRREIADAADREAAATIEGLLESHGALAALAERHPGRANAQVAHAWHAVLLGELFGDPNGYLKSAAASLDRIGGDTTALGIAARAGAAHLRGEDEKALELARGGRAAHKDDARLALVEMLALRALGQKAEALEIYEAARNAEPHYLPALQIALMDAIDEDDNARAKRYATELMTLSSGDLVGALGSIAIRLPGWYDAPNPSGAEALLEDMRTLRAHFEGAPPRIAALGFYLLGRVDLEAGKAAEAAESLRKALEKRPSATLKAWSALAVRRVQGPLAALAVLEGVDAGKSPEIASLVARCHLDLHHVASAQAAVAALESSGAPDAAELAWILAIRRGDAAKAKEKLPAAIDSRLEWVGLEMHDLMRRSGDAEGVKALVERFENPVCAEALRAFHSGDAGRVFSIFESEEKRAVPCVAALTARLMRGHLAPAVVRRAAEEAVAASDGDLRARIDRALAVWLTEGQAAAEKALDEVAAVKPETGLLLEGLVEAYLTAGLPGRALDAAAACTSPTCAGLRIAAAKGAGDEARAASELASAGDAAGSPWIALAAVERDLTAQKFDSAIGAADRALPGAGTLCAEIAAMKSEALSAKGERGDADRSLLGVSDRVLEGVGIDESWAAKLAMVRANLKRGGKFSFKAFGVAFEMYKAGVKDAELSYSYAVANIDQGNERGALRYLREAIDLDPSFVPAYKRLQILNKLPDDLAAQLERTLPGALR